MQQFGVIDYACNTVACIKKDKFMRAYFGVQISRFVEATELA